MRRSMSFLFSTVFATPLQKLTAENAARSATQCVPDSAFSQRFARSSAHTECALLCLLPTLRLVVGTMRRSMSFLFSTVFATPLQKLTAENAARSATQCVPHSVCHIVPLRNAIAYLMARSLIKFYSISSVNAAQQL